MNENTSLFGNAQLQIELKPHTAVEAIACKEPSVPLRVQFTTANHTKHSNYRADGRSKLNFNGRGQ